MLFLGLLFTISGLTGLFLGTVGAPFVAAFMIASVAPLRAAPPRRQAKASERIRLEVLVAAYNEESVIEQTLSAVREAALKFDACDLDVSITVGLDHCTDKTAALVAAFESTYPGRVKAIENQGERGKWNVLNMLIEQSDADWVALVDAAAIWDRDVLVKAYPMLLDQGVIGVAPSYAPQKSGLLERLNWRLEQLLKSVENVSGGPVSVHGASVLYRRSELMVAIKALKGTMWLNDDVAIPLTLRMTFPNKRIVYLADRNKSGWISDVGVRAELDVEYRRRKRMLLGNLQWVSGILLPHWRKNLIVSLVASRRVFRMMWAYWVLFTALGFSMICAWFVSAELTSSEQKINILLICGIMTVLAICGVFFSNWLRRLSMAFVSGLQLPRFWKEFGNDGRGVSWL